MKKRLKWDVAASLTLIIIALIAAWPRYLPVERMHGEPPERESFEEMVNHVELIVLADVKAVKQGPDYASPIIGTDSVERYPTQRITLEVVEVYKGDVAQGQSVTLYQEGVGVTRSIQSPWPVFRINENDPVYERGERYILMLWPVPISEEVKPYQPEPWQEEMFSVIYPEGRMRLKADGTVTSVLDSFRTNGKTLEEIEAMIAESTGEAQLTSSSIKAIYLVLNLGQLSSEDVQTHPEVIVTNTFDDFKKHARTKVALWIDKDAIELLDQQWLHETPQKYYPLALVGYNEPLYAFREALSGFEIEGPYADWSAMTLEPGFSVWMLREETGSSLSAFMSGYNQKPTVQDILDITNALLEGKTK